MSRMDLASMIESRDGVRSGKPCFVGTRITVDDVLEYMASGMTTQEILHDFPVLSDAHLRAALGGCACVQPYGAASASGACGDRIV